MAPVLLNTVVPRDRSESEVALMKNASNRRLVTQREYFPERILQNWMDSSWLLTFVLVFAAVSISGFIWLSTYNNSPGQCGAVPPDWPAKSRLVMDSNRTNLVLVVHPRCPCSRATIYELSDIMAQCENAVTAHILWLKPQFTSDGWEVTDLWQQAAAIPGVRMVTDYDGVEALNFGAATSGQMVLFDHQGHLVFQGGITVSRGHRGENLGRAAVMDWLTKGTSNCREFCVFGCPLFANRATSKETP